MDTKYPKPDRSDQIRNFQKTEENEALDIGWAEGTFSDGRPYLLECWCEDQVTSITVFFSRIGLEGLDDAGAKALLERENIAHFLSEEDGVTALPCRDASGNEMWSANIVVGDDEETFITGGPALHKYPRTNAER